MKISKISYKIASWSLIVVGIGHLLTDLTQPKTPIQMEFILKMKEFQFELLGTQSDAFSFHQGYSIMMGIFLFAYGLLNLFIVKNITKAPTPLNILILNSSLCFVAHLVSLKYFFIIPIICTGVAFIGFSTAIFTQNKS